MDPIPPSPKEDDKFHSIFDAAPDGLIISESESGLVVEANPAACALHGYAREEFIGFLPEVYIHPDSQQQFKKNMHAFRSGAALGKRVLHKRRDGSTFQAEWHGAEFVYQDRPCLLAVVRDVSRRAQAEHQLRQRFEARSHEQSALLDISHTLASTLEFHPSLILEQLQRIIEYTHAAFFELTDSTLTALAIRGPQELDRAAPFLVRLEGAETLVTLFNGHRPIRIADVSTADPAAALLRTLLNGDAADLLQGVRAWMWVPLEVKGRILGGLGIAHTRRNYFTAHHAALALSMADQVAITMVNAELYQHSMELAVLQERQHLARNLHDAVNQSLFSASLIAEVLPRLWDRNQVEARQSLEDLRRLTRGAQAEMRGLLAELRPSVLTDSSMGDLLRQLANAFTGRTNVPASVTIAGEHVLSADIQMALYRICQEALNNIAKHAKASRVEIELQYHLRLAQVSLSFAEADASKKIVVSSLEMRIRDDGQGFNTSLPPHSGHYGLGMMSERATAVGARLSVTSWPGGGTEIAVRWQKALEREAR
jgi:PAS domain S-box-containing protein